MIDKFRSGTVAVLVAAAMLFQCAGCSGSKTIPHPLDRYDDRSFAPAATFYFPVFDVGAAALPALKHQGCTILAVDSISHTIRAEIRSTTPIPADSLAAVRSISETSLLEVLGLIVLAVPVLMLMLFMNDWFSGSDDEDSSETTEVSDTPPPTVYVYDISLIIYAIDDSTTDVELDVQRIAMADSLLISSAPFENIYFNYPVFDEIQRELGRVVEDTTVVK